MSLLAHVLACLSACPCLSARRTWLFRTLEDPGERCDLSLSQPAVVSLLRHRMEALQATAVPCRFPNGDAAAAQAWAAAGNERGPWRKDP